MPAGVRPAASDRPPIRGADSSRSIVPGARLAGRFVLASRVHAGGQSEVWRALDALGAVVAVKLARAEADDGRAELLRAEYALLTTLAHPSILRPVALVDEGPIVALVSEYLPGGDLVSVAGAAPRHWAPGAVAVLDALTYLHGRGLVHRDVKARNVMFDATGRARLIDFGSVAPVGAPRNIAGTTAAHRYRQSGRVACGDDVHAFAVLVYELLAGRLPAARVAGTALASPLPGALAGSVPCAALAALVVRTLTTRRPEAGDALHEYRDRLESILAEERGAQ